MLCHDGASCDVPASSTPGRRERRLLTPGKCQPGHQLGSGRLACAPDQRLRIQRDAANFEVLQPVAGDVGAWEAGQH